MAACWIGIVIAAWAAGSIIVLIIDTVDKGSHAQGWIVTMADDSDQQHANEPAWAFEGDEWVPLVEDTALSQITPAPTCKFLDA